ncbi:MAG: hypothetical protein L0332_07925, partial [Chloroflexi bacterium]|nr:hypothetical protein [Chloroflexota bacterium]
MFEQQQIEISSKKCSRPQFDGLMRDYFSRGQSPVALWVRPVHDSGPAMPYGEPVSRGVPITSPHTPVAIKEWFIVSEATGGNIPL